MQKKGAARGAKARQDLYSPTMRPSFGRRAPNLRTRRRFVGMGKAGSCKLVPGLACGRVTTVPELDGRKEPGSVELSLVAHSTTDRFKWAQGGEAEANPVTADGSFRGAFELSAISCLLSRLPWLP
eukprot:scaffold2626_cov279-Pinguiococcus_pyrenoidosus.AAC.9